MEEARGMEKLVGLIVAISLNLLTESLNDVDIYLIL